MNIFGVLATILVLVGTFQVIELSGDSLKTLAASGVPAVVCGLLSVTRAITIQKMRNETDEVDC